MSAIIQADAGWKAGGPKGSLRRVFVFFGRWREIAHGEFEKREQSFGVRASLFEGKILAEFCFPDLAKLHNRLIWESHIPMTDRSYATLARYQASSGRGVSVGY